MTKKILTFEITVVLLVAALTAVIINVQVPYAGRVYREARDLWMFWGFKQHTTDIATQKNKLERENRALDSLLAASERRYDSSGVTVMAGLYKSADSAGLHASKVEISERIRVGDHFETPVTVRGSGAYAAVGRFCEVIENLPAPVRVRQISATAPQSGTVEAIVDFVVLAQ
jgi:hypothetical protein